MVGPGAAGGEAVTVPNPNGNPGIRPGSHTWGALSAHAVLERALDAGYVIDAARPHFRTEMGHALVREALETMEILEGDAQPCQRCRERRREAVVAARGRRRMLSTTLALASLPLSILGLYAFGSMSPWWGLVWFAAALGGLVLSVLTEERKGR